MIPASYYSQVSDLFICKDEHLWGVFNEAGNKLEIHDKQQPGDQRLLDRASQNILLTAFLFMRKNDEGE